MQKPIHLPRLKSLRALVAAAVVLTVVPLVGASLYGTWSAHIQLTQSSELVNFGVRVAARGEGLSELVVTLERNARQYSVMDDPALAQMLSDRRRQLLELIDAMTAEDLSARAAELLSKLRRLAAGPLDRISASGSEDLARSQEEAFVEMRGLAAEIRAMNRADVERRLGELSTREAAKRRGLIGWSVGLFVLAVLLIIVFARLIGRPLSQLLSAIGRLGRGEFEDPVVVEGPSDLEAVGQELDWLRRRLKTFDDEKNSFMRQLSHDFKTPLTNIREGTDLLIERGELDAESDHVARIVHRNTQKLESLINHLLDFTAWQTHSEKLRIEPCRVRTLIESTLSEHDLPLHNRGVELDNQVPSDLEISADPARLTTLFDNLISNAVKYSPTGGAITISAKTTADRVYIDVRDEGPGFSAEDRSRALEPFYRGKPGANGSVPGTGIGMSVANACARAHGGSIQICDSCDKGAHVRVELPRRVDRLDAAGGAADATRDAMDESNATQTA